MRYKNMSNHIKTFYGVTFNPGEVHDVPGAINVNGFIPTTDPLTEPLVEPECVSEPKPKRKNYKFKEGNVDG